MYLLIGLVFIVITFWAFERFYLYGKHEHEYPAPVEHDSIIRFPKTKGTERAQEVVVRKVRDITILISQAVEAWTEIGSFLQARAPA